MATQFNVTWLTHPKYIRWLEAVKGVPTSVFCRPCLKIIALSNMGKRALDSHATSKKHIQCVSTAFKSAGIKDFFSKKGPVVKSENCKRKESSEDEKENTDGARNLVIPPPPTPPAAGVSQSSNVDPDQETLTKTAQPAPKLSRWLQSKETRKAEILWTLKSTQEHQSFRDNEHTSKLVQNMFWDSNIAAQ